MTEKRTHEGATVVARIGDRSYTVPAGELSQLIGSDTLPPGDPNRAPGQVGDVRFHVAAKVRVVDGRPLFLDAHVTAYRPLTPTELQRVPWAAVAEAVVVSHAARVPSERLAVAAARRRERAAKVRAEARDVGPSGPGGRRPVDAELLAEVDRLRLEAEADPGIARWDHYVADRLGYSTGYMRRLGSPSWRRQHGFAVGNG